MLASLPNDVNLVTVIAPFCRKEGDIFVLLGKRENGLWSLPGGSGALKDALEDPRSEKSIRILSGPHGCAFEELTHDLCCLGKERFNDLIPLHAVWKWIDERVIKFYYAIRVSTVPPPFSNRTRAIQHC